MLVENYMGIRTVAAFDPGKATGCAVFSKDAGIGVSTFETFKGIASYGHCAVFVVERPFKSEATDTVVFEVFGVVKERAWANSIDLMIQPPSVPDFICKRYELNMLVRGKKLSIHEKDALAHLINYLIRTEGMEESEVLSMVRKIGI